MTFQQLGIMPEAVTYLAHNGIRIPTDIQTKAIPLIVSGRDILAHSRTGTGKTLAFLLPVMEKIQIEEAKEQVLILTPTRELARQIAAVAQPLVELYDVDMVALTGGSTREQQLQKLKRRPQLIIGTPGRILDHFRQESLQLSSIRTVVLDEADQMLAMGFLAEVRACIDATPKSRQLLLFSATLPVEVRKLAKSVLRQPVSLNADGGTIVLENIEQRIYMLDEEDKLDFLVQQLAEMNPYLAIIFCNTKERATRLSYALARKGVQAEELHGDLSQSARNRILRDFADGRFPYLVASDIAARGIDVEGVSHVFNYDVPSDMDYYIHRIGRTGRAGATGIACTYVTERDMGKLRRIEARIEQNLIKYDREGNVHIRRPRAKRAAMKTSGNYRPTAQKAHKQKHRGRNVRRRRASTTTERKRKNKRGKRQR